MAQPFTGTCMPQIAYQSLTSAALDADGLANDVAYSGGGYALSATSAGDSLAHLITILGNAVTDHSLKTFTVTGTDGNGNPQSEGIAGPNGNVTVTTTKWFKTVTSVTVSATTGADTFDIGWTAESVGPLITPNLSIGGPSINIELFCVSPATGNATYSVIYTADANPNGLGSTSWLTHATITGKSATFDGQITTPILGFRLKITVAGSVAMTVIQHQPRGAS